MEIQIFHHAKILLNLHPKKKKKILSNKTKIFSKYYYNSINYYSQLSTQAKNIVFQKPSCKNRPIIIIIIIIT